MAKVTQQQAILAYMDNNATVMRDDNGRSTKYVTYYCNNSDMNYYVGNKGALRRGKTVKNSIPVSEYARLNVIAKGNKILTNG